MDTQHDEHVEWAYQVFGHANLGDARRTERLVAMGASVARHPAGTVTAVFKESADRQGAYRLLENPAVTPEAVGEAVFGATARQCVSHPYVFVPLDGSSLTLTDLSKRRELGRIGSGRSEARGLQVQSALAVDSNGAVIGLLDQRMWARTEPPLTKKEKRRKRSPRVHFSQKETRHWIDGMHAVKQRMAEQAPGTKPWFQLDRGGDCWPVLKTAVEEGMLLTVRATHNRRLVSNSPRRRYLHPHVQTQPVLGRYAVAVPERPNRPARVAHMTVRACTVTLDLKISCKRRASVTLQAVLAQETSYRGKDRLRWMLLTTHPVRNFAEARGVVAGYSQRWRIEEFHRAWKAGGCHVEDTQLQSLQAIRKWAIVLGAVASRAVRLAYLGRTNPDAPASEEFTADEIDAVFLLLKRKRDRRRRLRLGEMIALIAELGGFAHKYSKKRRPGPTVIARGLQLVEVLALGLKNMREM